MNVYQRLLEERIRPSPVIDCDWTKAVRLNLSKENSALAKLDLNNENEFKAFIFNQIPKGSVGYGGYGEERSLYARSDLFGDQEPRTIHLGVDIWTSAGTPVYSPLDAKVHSLDNRAYHGDYGPVIILEHQLGNQKLYSLYGHLSTSSLNEKAIGQSIKQGEEFASLGTYSENFHWPPHLHFQLIWDMEGNKGDYPGVCIKSKADHYLKNCPDPMELLT